MHNHSSYEVTHDDIIEHSADELSDLDATHE